MKDIQITIKLNKKPFLTDLNQLSGLLKDFLQASTADIRLHVNSEEVVSKFDELQNNIQTALAETSSTIETAINDTTETVVSSAAETINQIKEVVTATGQNINQASKEINSTFVKQLGEIGFAITGIKQIVTGVIHSVSGLVNASNIQEKALNGLKSSFKTLGEDTQANIKYYQDFATAMQKVTTTGDEQILMLVTLAANMGVAQNQREEAVKGAIGLATAFTNAGLSQETALKGIAQAYEGNFSMLGRYITTIQNASSEAEKMTIMQQLMANGFTMAKDEVNTGAGALQQYQNLVGDLKEHLGDLLKSICLPIVKILGVIASYLNEHQILFKALAGTIFIYSAAMAQSYIVKIKNIIALGALNTQSAALAIVQGVLTIKTKTVAAAQWLWNNAVLAHPIIAFLASLAILTAALIGYHKATKEAEKAQQQLNDTIKSNIRAATEQTKNNLNAQFKAQMENYELRIKNGENLYEQLKTYAIDNHKYETIVLKEGYIKSRKNLTEKMYSYKKIFSKLMLEDAGGDRLDKKDMIQKIKQSIEARVQTLSPNVAYEIWGYAEQTFSTGQILTLDKVYYKVLEIAFEYETLDHIKSFTVLCINIQKT